ncbi:major facilitator superfamily domain-containing protein [Zychaea mexicana]|uniref:major facilitator superfamily domain-containing protein n=1 Tax=Zychaea mexicana TaxID=64656 RepID=UPI0022FDD108|nr:major facilitator superfamily domain-containing protein [Zychaea mexicana]KAI9495237.1 major facilitator superfamily domain-containing protein [Zychaea mexicana]
MLSALTYCCVFLANFLIPMVGVKLLLLISTIMISLGLVLSGLATHVWHLYLSCSLCCGIGISLMYGVIIGVLPQWFVKKRSTVFGFQSSMLSATALIFPFIITVSNDTLGIVWMYRILGLAFFALNAVAILLIKERPSDNNITPLRRKKKILDTAVLKNKTLVVWTIAGPIFSWCQYITYTFLPQYATYLGLSTTESSATITVFAATSIIGRVVMGLLADRLGNLNTYIVFTTIASLLILFHWMFAYDLASLISFAIVYGLFSGGHYALASPITVAIAGLPMYPAATSFRMLAYCFGIVGPTIASTIEEATNGKPYLCYKLFAGFALLICVILACIVRHHLSKKVCDKI